MNTFRKSLLCGAIAFMGIGSLAYAAQNTGGSGSHEHGSFSCGQMHHGKDFREGMAKRQTVLHDKLKLTAQQETAWKSYVAAIKPDENAQRPNAADWEKLSAPERMEKMLGKMKEHQSIMEKHLSATKTFYATLTPKQQKIFNDSMNRIHGRRGHK